MARNPRLVLAVGVLVLMSLAVVVQAQEVATAGDVADLGRSMRELVELLRSWLQRTDEDLELRRLEVAIAALDIRSRAISRLETELQSIRDRRDGADQRRERMQRQIEELEDRLLEADPTGEPAIAANLRQAKARTEAEAERLDEEIWRLDQRILDLENAIVEKVRAIQHLEELVDEALSRM